MSDFIKKVNLLFNETYSSKYGIIIKRDANDESDDFNIQIIEVTESASVLPVIEPDPVECRYLSVDTKPVNEVTKPEYNKSITKPEEAGGLYTLKIPTFVCTTHNFKLKLLKYFS